MRRPAQETIVSLTFDDGLASHHALIPLFRRYGVCATFFVSSGKIGEDVRHLEWWQLEALAADGHEIGGHTRDHVKLTTLDPAEARTQIRADRLALLDRGFVVTNFAYPHGAMDAVTREAVEASGYNSARRSWGLAAEHGDRPCTETIPPLDPYAIRTAPSVDPGAIGAELERMVSQAERAGGWLQLVFHEIPEMTAFDSFLAWLAPRSSRGTQVRRVADVIGGACRRPPL